MHYIVLREHSHGGVGPIATTSLAVFSIIEMSTVAVLGIFASKVVVVDLSSDMRTSGVGRLRSWKFCTSFKDKPHAMFLHLGEANMRLDLFGRSMEVVRWSSVTISTRSLSQPRRRACGLARSPEPARFPR